VCPSTLYGWRRRGEGPRGYTEWDVTFDTAEKPSRLGLTAKPTGAGGDVAHIERRRLNLRESSGRTRTVVHYKVRYRDATGKHHSETKTRLVDAERRKAEIEVALATATWRDPKRGELSLAKWAHIWLPTRLDLRPTTWARLETTMQKQVLPYFGSVPLNRITNAMVREWVSTLLSTGCPQPLLARPFSLCGNASLLRLRTNAFSSIPRVPCPFLLSARSRSAIYRKAKVERLVDEMPRQ
jgi:Phage integrase, N-terminal SAM-like domain